jgi:hypothetical protein
VQTSLPVGVADPLKLLAQAFVACHEIVKSQNDTCEKMFLFFPIRFGSGKRSRGNLSPLIAIISRTTGPLGNELLARPIVSADGTGAIHALPG